MCGLSLNVLSDYDSECEAYLSRAVKLNPKLPAAWNELGECYYKKGDIKSAHNCFKGALQHVSILHISKIKIHL